METVVSLYNYSTLLQNIVYVALNVHFMLGEILFFIAANHAPYKTFRIKKQTNDTNSL